MGFIVLLPKEMNWILKKREQILGIFPEKKISKTYIRVLTTFITRKNSWKRAQDLKYKSLVRTKLTRLEI